MTWFANFRSKAFFQGLYDKALETDLLGRAAQVAFYFSFAFFPLLLFLITLLGIILESADTLQAELYSYLAGILPASAYDLVFSTMNEVVETSSGGKMTLGLFVTLWSASAGVDSLRSALNSVYEVDEDRAWWKTKLQSLILTLLFILLLAITLATVTAGIKLFAVIFGNFGIELTSPWLLTAIQGASMLIVMLFATAVVYSWLPSFEEFHWVWVSPGSVFAIILWVLLTGGFRLYLSFFNSYNATYGSLGAVIILMLWMYLTGLALLMGGAINSVLTEMSHSSGAKEAQKDEKAKMINELKKKQSEEKSQHNLMSLMLEEIAEQPAVLEQTIANEAAKYRQLGNFLRGRDIDLIVIAARGSSDNASLFGRYLLEVTAGIPVSLAAPSVHTLYNAKLNLKRSLVIGVSQSGEGSDINIVLDNARASGAFTLAITNETDSTMAGLADETLLIHAGKERSVAATKTYTGQMLHFYLLANELAEKRLEVDKIPAYTAKALDLKAKIEELVQRYVFMENCVVVGRGMNYGNSYELALKLMETCYVVAERFSSADFFHGPLAIIERRFPVITFGPTGVTHKSSVDLLQRLRELNADCLSITNSAEISKLSTSTLLLPAEIEEFLSPIPFIVPAQLFAALLSAAKGLDPDAPRSLSKVTRTV